MYLLCPKIALIFFCFFGNKINPLSGLKMACYDQKGFSIFIYVWLSWRKKSGNNDNEWYLVTKKTQVILESSLIREKATRVICGVDKKGGVHFPLCLFTTKKKHKNFHCDPSSITVLFMGGFYLMMHKLFREDYPQKLSIFFSFNQTFSSLLVNILWTCFCQNVWYVHGKYCWKQSALVIQYRTKRYSRCGVI